MAMAMTHSYPDDSDPPTPLPAATSDDEIPETTASLLEQEGMLPRDRQEKTAYYDYTAEKQLSQADAKLFYQRSQLETQKTGGSNWGPSQSSPPGTPLLASRPTQNGFDASSAADIGRSNSVTSIKSAQRQGTSRLVGTVD
jgi:AMP deaminase